MSHVRPWQVWRADLGDPVGSEQGGARPVLIVASTFHCRFPIRMTIVVPLTTRDRGLSHHVLIDSTESGLSTRSWARTEDITAVSTNRLHGGRPLGQLTEEEVARVQHWTQQMLA